MFRFLSPVARVAHASHNTLPASVPVTRPCQYTTTALREAKNLPPRPKPPPDAEIDESFLKGSGPGGQKINKTNSAVQLRHVPTGIVVKSQATRSRSQNRKQARELLAQKLDDFLNGHQSRSSIVGEVKRKKAASAAKKSRRKYRKLHPEQETGEGSQESVVEDLAAAEDEAKGSGGQSEAEAETVGAAVERNSSSNQDKRP
ncbi:peptidyl-tRNA hydrolase domain protein [Drechmeria coniospora]|uniref:Peptidyl-tRNA hydrolase domain protein n=1 Tax=Drechmeria coniospora TaxID=98403 RepID=A0A151GNI5_DRECN|nr:peptidyl-tRNA hydrolase domain protein [Drechmeria coniospora]KYK58669.1 peptidyl-tRNA hydrolase domain protein [Drechmeria coniospora]